MKAVFTISVLCSVVYVCFGGCWIVPSQYQDRPGVFMPCFIGGEVIPRGSSVTKNCQSCYCDFRGFLKCCSVGTKVKHFPNDCKKIVSPDGCYEHVVKMSDEQSMCMYGVGMVGR